MKALLALLVLLVVATGASADDFDDLTLPPVTPPQFNTAGSASTANTSAPLNTTRPQALPSVPESPQTTPAAPITAQPAGNTGSAAQVQRSGATPALANNDPAATTRTGSEAVQAARVEVPAPQGNGLVYGLFALVAVQAIVNGLLVVMFLRKPAQVMMVQEIHPQLDAARLSSARAYVAALRAKNAPDNLIRGMLSESGWPAAYIDEALR